MFFFFSFVFEFFGLNEVITFFCCPKICSAFEDIKRYSFNKLLSFAFPNKCCYLRASKSPKNSASFCFLCFVLCCVPLSLSLTPFYTHDLLFIFLCCHFIIWFHGWVVFVKPVSVSPRFSSDLKPKDIFVPKLKFIFFCFLLCNMCCFSWLLFCWLITFEWF